MSGDGATRSRERPCLDALRLSAWLCSDEVVDAQGRVASWCCAAHPGYAYPEAGGLWLSWAADALAPDDARALRVVGWLERELDGDRIGRDGHAYAFDLGVVLRGLLQWSARTGRSPSVGVQAGARRLCAAIVEQRAAWPLAPARWSTHFGGHQAKLSFALDAIDRAGLGDVAPARAQLLERLDALDRGGEVYLHAQAYALEAAASAGHRDRVERWLGCFRALQAEHGGLPAFAASDGAPRGPARSDVTAQAVRLWAWHDRARWRECIDRGLAFLIRQTSELGGVRYDDESDDRNVWCTLFALQADRFARGAAEIDRLW